MFKRFTRNFCRVLQRSYHTKPNVTLTFDNFGEKLQISSFVENLDHIQKALKSKPFQEWIINMNNNKHMKLNGITIQSIDMFGEDRMGFMKFIAHVKEENGERSFIVFMRGGSVAVLPILECENEEWVVLVTQHSIPTAQSWFPSLPAGMLDGSGDLVGVAAKEMYEETGIKIKSDKLIDMIDLAYGNKYRGVFTSVGGTDEYVRLYLFKEKVDEKKINELKGRLTGVKEEGEIIKVQVVKYDELWKHTSDVKVLSAMILYEKLKKEGKI